MKTFDDIKMDDILQLRWIGETFWVKVTGDVEHEMHKVTIIDDNDIDKGTMFYADKQNFLRIWDISELFTL